MNPKVSLIIPSYKDGENNFKTLKKSIESVKKQDYPNLEIIVVVDGSKDGTINFLKKYKGIKVISNKKNMGLSKTLNKGIKFSKGNLIVTLHSDSELVGKNWISNIVEIFEDSSIGAVTSNPIIKSNVELSGFDKFNLYFLGAYNTRNIKKPVEIGMLANKADMYRKSVLDEVGYFNEKYKVSGEDIDLCSKIQKRGYKLILTPESSFIINISPIQDNFWKTLKKRFQYGRVIPKLFLDHTKSLFNNKDWLITTLPYIFYSILLLFSVFFTPLVTFPILFNLLVSYRVSKAIGFGHFLMAFFLIPIFTLSWFLGIIYGLFTINKKRI